MNLQQIRIGTRLGLGFGLVLLLLVGAIGVAITLSTLQRHHMAQSLGGAAAKERLTGEMRAALLESAVAMRNVALESDVNGLQKQADKARADRKRYAQAKEKFEALVVGEEERALLADAAKLDKAVEQPFFQAVALAQAMSSEDATKVVATQVEPLQQKQIAVINGLQTLQEAASQQASRQAEADAATLNATLVVMGLAAVVIGLTLAWVFTKSITRPLQAAVRAAERVTAGDLGVAIVVEGADEAAQLLESMRKMTLQLQRLVSGVRDTAQDVTRTAHDISRGHADLSARTESQASSLQQTAASVEELTATVSKTAESAHGAHDLACGATKVATEGQAVVGRVVETMESIHRSSGRIAEINAVIDGIAFQTNILALNAAVEAARAGDAGRGFAVVASEVRQLAQRSSNAAKEIRQLIDASVQQTAVGSKLVADAGQTMGQVVSSIDRVRAIVGEISASSREQSVGIAQVNEAIAHIDGVTQQNAGFVESATSSATQLRRQAEDLVAAVSAFKIDAAAAHALR